MSCGTAVAQGFQWSLRAGTQPEPSNRPWEQGATISYLDVDGKSATLIDADLKAGYEWLFRRDETDASRGSTKVNLKPGIYIHKNTDDAGLQNDRGASLTATAHILPPSSGAGSVIHYDLSAMLKDGKSLKKGTGTELGKLFDVDAKRAVLRGSAYIQPGEGEFNPKAPAAMPIFAKIGMSWYSDELSGAQSQAVNGRVAGACGYLQLSIAPLGLDPAKNVFGALGFAPIFTLSTQGQHDTTATRGRVKENRRLYSALLSIPFTSIGEYKGLVPSLDIQRSVGSDVLIGREYRRETKISLSLMF
jgi:hypothetical protein